jgi:ribosomal protein L30/L7E
MTLRIDTSNDVVETVRTFGLHKIRGRAFVLND